MAIRHPGWSSLRPATSLSPRSTPLAGDRKERINFNFQLLSPHPAPLTEKSWSPAVRGERESFLEKAFSVGPSGLARCGEAKFRRSGIDSADIC